MCGIVLLALCLRLVSSDVTEWTSLRDHLQKLPFHLIDNFKLS
jgi:hypothetical protein